MEVKPNHRWLWWPATVLLTMLGFAAGLLYSQLYPLTDSGQAQRQLQVQLADVSRAYRQTEDQRRQLELLREIDLLAAARMRDVYNESLAQNASLSETLALYKGVLEPENQLRGLQVRDMEVRDLGDQAFGLRAVFSQLDIDAVRINAKARIQLIGVDRDFAGELIIMPLSDLSSDLIDEELDLDFVVYQVVDVLFSLPVEFTPVQIEVVLIPERGSAITRLFDWQLME